MRYVRRVLQPGETIVYSTKLHWRVYIQAILLVIACIIITGAAVATNDNQGISLGF